MVNDQFNHNPNALAGDRLNLFVDGQRPIQSQPECVSEGPFESFLPLISQFFGVGVFDQIVHFEPKVADVRFWI